MISTQEISELLATLYAAPLEPEKWQVLFDHLSRLTKISTGILMTCGEDSSPSILAAGGFAWNPEMGHAYNEHYAELDPFRAPSLHDRRVAVIRGEELVTRDRLLKTEFYNDLLSKNEMESMTMLSFNSTKHAGDFMPVWRRAQDGPMDDASISLLETLLPHVQTALEIRKKLQTADLQSHFSEVALESMGTAALLVSADGHVLHMNSLAATIVKKADGLRLEGASLTARNPGESARLKSIILGAAMSGRPGAQTEPGGAMNISRQGTKLPLQVAVLPLPEMSRQSIKVQCALVFICDPAAAPRPRSEALRALYALTPAEARLADLLLQGLDVAQAAQQLHTTLATTRFQLKRVQAKTNTHRQSELIKLMLSLPGQ
jgi:DNA-binding CsgD family transcriptional regulator/PAS domain-containing protein